MAATVIPNLDAVGSFVGKPLGVSRWVTVTQERIDAFADATGDHQWIHCDPERARRDSPWKSTIAHGYLTLSLAPALLAELLEIGECSMAVNIGIDKLRLSAPVPAGSRVRMSAEIRNVRRIRGGGVRVSLRLRFEVEGSPKPACIASVNFAYFP